MADERDEAYGYEKKQAARETEMLVQMATMAAFIGIIAGRQLSGKSINPDTVADEALSYGRAMAKKLKV